MLNPVWAIWEEQPWIRFPLFLPLRPRVDLNPEWFLFVQEPNPRVIPSSYVLMGYFQIKVQDDLGKYQFNFRPGKAEANFSACVTQHI